MHRASPETRRNPVATTAMIGVALAVVVAPCRAEDRAPNLIPGAYPYAASVVAKAQHAETGIKNLSAPVLKVIAPDPPAPAIALPDRRSAVDQMMESHEFTFGRNRRAANYAGSRPPAGSGMDLDAVKLRVSRDKVLLKAEWTFN